jgi:hypothetical protein
MKTLCKKCLFADLANSSEPCAMNVVDHIDKSYSISVDDEGFNVINDYRCLYGFDLSTYDKNKENIGSISTLTEEIYKRCEIPYYMAVFVTEERIDSLLDQLSILSVKPKYLSLILFGNNNTTSIISLLKNRLSGICEWKLHNFLQNEPKEKALNVIFDTNKRKNNSQYTWILDRSDYQDIDKQISDINHIISMKKPKTHMFCKTPHFSLDGLFISFDNFTNLCKENERIISEGVQDNISNIIIYQY